jgi:hypothetical protein
MMYYAEMASCGIIFLPNFIKIGTCVQAILRFGLSNLNGCNIQSFMKIYTHVQASNIIIKPQKFERLQYWYY